MVKRPLVTDIPTDVGGLSREDILKLVKAVGAERSALAKRPKSGVCC